MQVISTFLAYLRLERGAGANTLSSYEHDVRHFSGWLDAAQANARRTDLQRYISDSLDTEVISREDNPSLTAWRIKHLFAGKSCAAPAILESNLYVNSRAQWPELMLDSPERMAELLAALRQVRPRFAIFDVFNRASRCGRK